MQTALSNHPKFLVVVHEVLVAAARWIMSTVEFHPVSHTAQQPLLIKYDSVLLLLHYRLMADWINFIPISGHMRGAGVSETFKNARRNRRVNQILDWFVFLFLGTVETTRGYKRKNWDLFSYFCMGWGIGVGDFVILICFV
jgi:hypothetical protein